VPNVMVVHPSVPAATVPEFIAYAKSKPDKTTMASVGNGSLAALPVRCMSQCLRRLCIK
jgi:tripartite-type tricarboxylate transporter receptor subunit TctC